LQRLFIGFARIAWVLTWIPGVYRPAQAQTPNYLHTEGNRLVDANGVPVIVTGISWFGLETENYAPHGLWARSLDSFLDQIVELGFNTIRLPFSSQLLDPSSLPNGINYDLNPDLKGLSGLEIMDRVIAEAGVRGLKVILDRHRPDSQSQSELWYTPQYSEERWINDWVLLAQRYAGDDTMIGADLHNEPHGSATWGSDDSATDWRLAAERAGNAILKVNPDWLIIVQGVQNFQGDSYWWGGNLVGAREYPVRLDVPNQLVYSPHTYGPGVYPQPWFSDPNFPDNMPEIWDHHWGYLNREGIAPVILGEFGGRSVKNDKEGVWQQALVSYLRENQISYLYWTLNPNSGDTGGILLDDWQSVDPEKAALLSSYQFPLIGSGKGQVLGETVTPEAPATTMAAPTEAATTKTTAPVTTQAAQNGELRVRYRTSQQADTVIDSKPEFIITNNGQTPVNLDDLELIYWYKDDPGETYLFACDWAQIGCETVTGEFEALPDGSYSMQVRFQSSLELPPGQGTGEIKLRFNRADWSEFNQSDDYSFSAASDYVEWEKVTLYLDGARVWGNEPGATLMNTATPIAVAKTATPSLVQPVQTVTVTSAAEPVLPTWVNLVIAGVLAFAAGLLIAAILVLRRNR
jgi:endoglucanase